MMADHVWRVATQQRQFANVVDKWQSYVSRGNRLPGDIEIHGLEFVADDDYVQLACVRCGAPAAANNALPINGPWNPEYWARRPCE